MLTKAQKKQHVELGAKKIKESKNLIFVDFSGVPVADITNLKNELKKQGAAFKVIKKRLLKIALKEAGIEFDPVATKAPLATIFAPGELTSVAGPIYKFTKDLKKRKIDFKVVSVFDKEHNAAITTQEFNVIAMLPSREVLLAQVAGAFAAPISAFMYILEELSKRVIANNANQGGNNANGTAPISETAPEKKVEIPSA